MPEAVIVGAGISGLLSARALLREGWRVQLLEQGRAARESTWAGGGILSPMNPWRYPDGVTALALHGYAVYAELAAELVAFGADPEHLPGGKLSLMPPDMALAAQWAARWNVTIERLDPGQVRELEPGLKPVDGDSVFMPDVGRIRPPRLGRALLDWVLGHGATLTEEAEVTGFRSEGDRVTGVETGQGVFGADVVIVTAGAWTRRVMTQCGTSLEIEPVRGQMLLFKGADGLLDRIVLDGDRYLIPRADGRMLIGSTVEQVGFDKSTTDSARADLQRSAVDMLPALADCEVEHHWSGLRPGKLDHLPVISADPRFGNLFVNAGHYRNGVILGPGSARLLADLVIGRTPWTDPAPYRIAA